VLVLRDGIVGTIAGWVRKRRKGNFRQLIEESDQKAHDRQRDWEPQGAPRAGEEVR
jgi:hypothetical protein